MPAGFMGRASRAYLTTTSEAMTNANKTKSQITSDVNLGKMRHPISPDEAASGGAQTGTGDSSNIVVDTATYEQALRMVDDIDDKMGEMFYKMTMELEQMCQTSYVVPQTNPRFLSVCETVKGSMGNFRGLTEELSIAVRRFSRNMMDIQ